MIEIVKNLFVGSEEDERRINGETGWFIIHACKEPYHRQALCYTGRAAPKDHPEYLIAKRPGCLVLNLVDANDAAYIPGAVIDAAVTAIRENIGSSKVLLHCNLGRSRSPTIALLYLAKYDERYRGLNFDAAVETFRQSYPLYEPARGMADFARSRWPVE